MGVQFDHLRFHVRHYNGFNFSIQFCIFKAHLPIAPLPLCKLHFENTSSHDENLKPLTTTTKTNYFTSHQNLKPNKNKNPQRELPDLQNQGLQESNNNIIQKNKNINTLKNRFPSYFVLLCKSANFQASVDFAIMKK